MLSPPSPTFRIRSPGNSSPARSQEVADLNPESFYQGLEPSMHQVDFERFFAKFPIESDVSTFFENFPLTVFHNVMVQALENVPLSEHDSPHGHRTRRARLVLEKMLGILDGMLDLMDGAELQVTDTRNELRLLKGEIPSLMGQELEETPADAGSSNPLPLTVADVDYGAVVSELWDTQMYNSSPRGAHGRYPTVPPSFVGYPTNLPSPTAYPMIPPSPSPYPTIHPSSVGYPTVPPSSVGYPGVPPSSAMYPTILPSSIPFTPTPSVQSSLRPPGFHDTPTPSQRHSHN